MVRGVSGVMYDRCLLPLIARVGLLLLLLLGVTVALGLRGRVTCSGGVSSRSAVTVPISTRVGGCPTRTLVVASRGSLILTTITLPLRITLVSTTVTS